LLDESLPQADKVGFFVVRSAEVDSDSGREKDKERWGSVEAWVRILPISKQSIKRYLHGANAESVKGKLKGGQIVDFYSESTIHSACGKLLAPDLTQSDEQGFIEKGGERWANALVWSNQLLISIPTIKNNLKLSKTPFIKGRDRGGRVTNYYSETTVRSACAQLLDESFPQADKSGFFEKEGEHWGSVRAWFILLSISEGSIKRSLKKAGCSLIRGRWHGGSITDFFSESDVRSACAELLKAELPQADQSGFFERDMERWGTVRAWVRVLLISDGPIKRNLEKSNASSIRGRNLTGRILDYYSESTVRSACADLLEKRRKTSNPKAA